MLEKDLKRAVDDILQLYQNMGKLLFLRLNSGDFIEVRGETRRRVRGCPKGTSDYYVLKDGGSIFLELKGESGRVSAEQKEFAQKVYSQGGDYRIIRNLDELETALFGDIKLREQG